MPYTQYQYDYNRGYPVPVTKIPPGELAYYAERYGHSNDGETSGRILGFLLSTALATCGYASTGWAPINRLQPAQDLRHTITSALGPDLTTLAGIATAILGLTLAIAALTPSRR